MYINMHVCICVHIYTYACRRVCVCSLCALYVPPPNTKHPQHPTNKHSPYYVGSLLHEVSFIRGLGVFSIIGVGDYLYTVCAYTARVYVYHMYMCISNKCVYMSAYMHTYVHVIYLNRDANDATSPYVRAIPRRRAKSNTYQNQCQTERSSEAPSRRICVEV